MSLYSWKVFIAVAEQKSFVKAAQMLNVTQSAVSHTIKKLEEEYGYSFFIRNRNNVELTNDGELLIPYVRDLIECDRSLSQQLNDLGRAAKGEVRIASFYSASRLWLPEIINRFKERYPDIQIRLRQTGDLQIRKMIDAGEVDLAFLSESYPTRGSFLPLHDTPMVCVGPPDFIPANGKSVSAKDLRGKPLIMQLEGYDTEIVQWLDKSGISDEAAYKIEVDSACHTYAEQGLGFCITTEMALACDPVETRAWPLDPPESRHVGLVTVYPDYMSQSARLFREEIIDYMNNRAFPA